MSRSARIWVFLMAGGRGQRLRPLTDECPKPMLPIAGRPILQIIIESMVRQGFHRFFISVNYKREMVREHFGDGSHSVRRSNMWKRRKTARSAPPARCACCRPVPPIR